MKAGALALALLSAATVGARADSSGGRNGAAGVREPCFPGAPAGLQLEAGKNVSPAMDAAAAAKLRTEQFSVEANHGSWAWSEVAAAAERTLQLAESAFGDRSECIVPFLDEAGAAAAGNSDPRLAESHYRRAQDILPDRPETLPYRAALASALASVLRRADRDEQEVAPVRQEAERLQREVQQAWPNQDPYEVMQSWVGDTMLEPVFLGPTSGAQKENDDALRIGVHGQPFGFQLHELHAAALLDGLPDVPPQVRETIAVNTLNAAAAFAVAQDDRQLLGEIVQRRRKLIAGMHQEGDVKSADWQTLSLAMEFNALGLLDKIGDTLDGISSDTLSSDRQLWVSVHALRADLSLLAGNPQKAREELRLAEERPPPGWDPGRLLVLERAALQVVLGRPDEASATLAPIVTKDTFGAEHHSQALRLNADLAAAQGRVSDAVQSMREAIAVIEGASEGGDEGPLGYGANDKTRQLAHSVDQAITLALSQPGEPKYSVFAVEAFFRARGSQLALSAERLRELHMMPLGAEENLRRLRALRSRVALELRSASRSLGKNTNWAKLQAVLDREDELQREFAKQTVGKAPRPPEDSAALLARLGKDSVVLAYTIYRRFESLRDTLKVAPVSEPRVAVALLRPGEEPRWLDLGTATEISAEVKELRHALAAPKGDQPDGIVASEGQAADRAAARARNLLGPWADDLDHLGRLIIMPDGPLGIVPFAALLPTADAGGPAISLVNGPDDLAERAIPAPTRPVILANPDFDAAAVEPPPDVEGLPPPASWRPDARYPALPGTGRELVRVQEALGSPEVLGGPRASKAALLGVRHPLVLHIATHAGFEPAQDEPVMDRLLAAANNPMLRSSLVFAGANNPSVRQEAIATALELSSLDLDGTELVVLSACETGLGGETVGEGIFGLRRAFAAAGARRLVFSLWKVDDDATAFLMGAFYDGLKTGKDADLALALAQVQTRRQPEWSHPYYWAGFVISGAHSPVPLAGGRSAPATVSRNAAAAASFRGEVAWKHRIGAPIHAAPWVGDSLVISASLDGAVHAVERKTGKLVWSFSTAGPVIGQPGVADGRVLVATEDGTLYAVDEADGRELWRSHVEGPVIASIARDGAYAYVAGGRLTSVNPVSGKTRWDFDPAAGQPPIPIGVLAFRQFGASPAADPDYLYLADEAGRFYKLRRDTGQQVWVTNIGAGTAASPILDGARILQATWAGDVICLDTQTGKEVWRYRYGKEIDSQVLLTGREVIVGSTIGDELVAVNADDGSMTWRVLLPCRGAWSLAARGPKIFIGAGDGFWALDRLTGANQKMLSSKMTATPSPAGREVFVGDLEGNLYAIQ